MQILQIINYLPLVVVSTCLAIGCDNPVTNKPSAEEQLVVETVESKPQSQQGSSAIGTSVAKEKTQTPLQSVSVEPAAIGSAQSSSAKTSVDHNDPTSYPVTKFAEKQAGQILMLSWNVESDGAEADTVCEEMKLMNAEDRYDIVALTEVLPQDLKKFRLALGEHYKYAYSKSGWHDRLQILYNENKFEKVRHFEVEHINVGGRYRAPLVVHLKQHKTESQPEEVEFLVMVNHLARGKAKIRQEQAKLLVEWAREQNLPVFGLGDYNFDYVFATDKGNPAFVNFMQDNIWRWVKPTDMVDTNWFDDPKEPDGKDDYPGSMLDFAFVAGPAKDWKSSCQIIVRENDFPDDEKTSDHRPYEVTTQN